MSPEVNLTEPSRHLLVIDDSLLRIEAFREAGELIDKLDKLEFDIASFQGEDQRRFTNWVKNNFRFEQRRLEELKKEHSRLVELHNWMVALIKQFDLSAPEAYRVILEEAEAYENAGQEERSKIDFQRRAREEFMRLEMEQESREELEDEEQSAADETSALMEELRSLDGAALEKLFSDQALLIDTLRSALSYARGPADYAVFLRIFDRAPISARGDFCIQYFERTGKPFARLLADIREAVGAAAFEEESSQPGNAPHHAAPASGFCLSPAEEERLKLIYRKLVRRLHPDLRPGALGKLGRWQQIIWEKAQWAYRARDLEAIERLYHTSLLRLRELNGLTIAEIKESQRWLGSDLRNLQRETNKLRRQPAWRFSRRKDYSSVFRRVQKELDFEFQSLESRVSEIREQHAFLGRLAGKA